MKHTIQPTDKYITFIQSENGSFDINKIETNLTCRPWINKPECAFWGSPVGSEYGWNWWCKNNDYPGLSGDIVVWTLKSDSKIFRIDLEDVWDAQNSPLLKYCNVDLIDCSSHTTHLLDFNKILKDGYSAIELMNCCIGHMFRNDLERSFNAWDCESIVVLDTSRLIILSVESST